MHPHRPARVCTITQAAPPKLPWCSKQLPKVAVQLSTPHFLTTTTQLWWPMGFQETSKNNRCSSTIQVRMWSSKGVKIPQFLVMIREEYVIIRYTLCLDSCDLYSHETIFCSLFVISFGKLQCFWRSCVPFLDIWLSYKTLPQLFHKHTPKTHRCLWTSWALPQIVDQRKTCLSRKMMLNASKRLGFHICSFVFSLFTSFYFHESERGFGSLVVKWHLLISIAGPIVHTLHPSAPQPCRSLSVAWLSPASAGLGHEVIKSLWSKRHGSFPVLPKLRKQVETRNQLKTWMVML